jgi:Bardet-Biedl syndrome 1 protein
MGRGGPRISIVNAKKSLCPFRSPPLAFLTPRSVSFPFLLRATPGQVHCCDLFGDGETRLIVASNDRKMKVWKGATIASEHTLLDQPTALCR